MLFFGIGHTNMYAKLQRIGFQIFTNTLLKPQNSRLSVCGQPYVRFRTPGAIRQAQLSTELNSASNTSDRVQLINSSCEIR